MSLCSYGCGKEAKFQLKNGKECCSKSQNSCLEIKKKNSLSGKGKHSIPQSKESNRKRSVSLRGKTKSEESRRKNRKSHLGKKWGFHTKDTREKLGKIRKEYIKRHPGCLSGNNNPNYGNGEKIRQLASKLTTEERSKKWGIIGENNSRWNPNREEVLKGYSLKWTTELKDYIRQRDSFICQLCGITEEDLKERNNKYVKHLRVHHIDYDKENCEEVNLVALCNSCNCRVNNKRTHWREFFNQYINLIVLEKEKEHGKYENT
jgi:hypothetical protein